jgi:hypothetical protein
MESTLRGLAVSRGIARGPAHVVTRSVMVAPSFEWWWVRQTPPPSRCPSAGPLPVAQDPLP